MNYSKKHSKIHAFTLIELLVTVALVGILSSMAIAQFGEYRARAVDARMKVLEHNLEVGIEAWLTDKWNGDTNLYLNWYHLPNSTEPITYRKNEIMEFTGDVREPGLLMWIIYNTICLTNDAVAEGCIYSKMVWVGHCDAGVEETFPLRRKNYNLNSTISEYYWDAPKSTHYCT